MKIPKTHPRYKSLKYRHLLVKGVEKGFVAKSGLIAHGRGEAFDYLIGEKTIPQALESEKAAVALLLTAKKPVISVNGNTAALIPKELVSLSRAVGADLEINLYYRTYKRIKLIETILRKAGAKRVLGVERKAAKRVPNLDSERSKVDYQGIYSADVVLVPLEDGDRVEALVAMGKKIISIDLNPLSRTSQKATVAIVDNVVRAVPNMIALAKEMKKMTKEEVSAVYEAFDKTRNLERITEIMRKGLV